MNRWETFLPPKTEEVNEKNLNEFFRLMYERQEIWHNRFILKQPKPWTKDSILSKYKFCNVYRELDRNSQWLINNVIKDENLSFNDLLFKIIIFRIYNTIEIFDHIKLPNFDNYDQSMFLNDLKYLEEKKNIRTLNTKAYLINTYMSKGKSYEVYANQIIPSAHKIIPEIVNIINEGKSVQDLINKFKQISGIGRFLAHEFFVDLCYLNKYVVDCIFPWTENDYTDVLPGSKDGIRWIFPSMRGRIEAIYILRDLAPEMLSKHGKFKYMNWDIEEQKYLITTQPNITLHQTEFILCEFNKYMKMLIGEGKQRKEFKPKTITT